MNPTITRFKLLCSILEDGISEACHGDADLEVWKEPWIAATLQLMSEDPCDGDCNFLNRQILFNAIIAPFTKLIDLLTILQSTDAEALADEYDYFFQDINDIMSKCWQKQPGTGKSGVVITPTFLTRETSNDGWEFDARNIRKLASHCEAQNAIATYRQKAISQEDQLQVDAVNIPKSDSAGGNLCTHLLFASAISDAEKIVTALESANDETLCTILSDGCSPLTIFQPFYATYYTPYTYYPEKSKKDLELGLSIPDDISTLKSWIERLFKCLQKIRNSESATRAAISQWKKIEALYDFRNLNPHLRLTRGQQNDFSDKLIELERLLISATQKENQASTTASSQVTASPRATRENNLQIRPGNETNTSHSLDATSIDSELSPPNIEFQKKLYCGRFKVSKDFKYIIDTIHRCKEYPSIQNLENTGGKVIEVLKKLFTAYGKKRTSGWVYSGGGSWCPHFGKKPYSTFKKQQIETRRNPSTNKSEWRIIPLAEFDEESPIGLHSKRKNHSNQKNNF